MQKQNNLFKGISFMPQSLSFRLVFRVGIIATALWFVYFAFSTIFIPYPLEYREGAAQVLTQFLLNGENPFSISSQPLAMNNYGIFYNLAVYPFAIFFGNTLVVYRFVNFVFLLFIFFIISQTACKNGGDRYVALACGLMVIIVVSSYGGFGAFPSVMGTFLFLSAVIIPFRLSFNFNSLWISAFLAVLAYYTKPYFVLSFGIVAGYIFLFVSKEKGLLYGFIFSLTFVVFYLPVRLIFDFYFINTFWGNIANTNKSLAHMYRQLFQLVKEFLPITILAGWIAYRNLSSARKTSSSGMPSLRIDLWNLKHPVFSQSLNYFLFWGLCSTLVFVFVVGGHMGAYMTYAYQLMLSPLLLWVSQKVNFKIYTEKIAVPLILLNMVILSVIFLNVGFLSQRNSPEWKELYKYVGGSTKILNSPVVVSAMLERGMLPVDSGQTQYYYRIVEKPYPQSKILGPGYSMFKKKGREYKETISRLVGDRYYDRLLLTEGQWLVYIIEPELAKNYTLVDKITVPMPLADQNWTIEVWEPIEQQ